MRWLSSRVSFNRTNARCFLKTGVHTIRVANSKALRKLTGDTRQLGPIRNRSFLFLTAVTPQQKPFVFRNSKLLNPLWRFGVSLGKVTDRIIARIQKTFVSDIAGPRETSGLREGKSSGRIPEATAEQVRNVFLRNPQKSVRRRTNRE